MKKLSENQKQEIIELYKGGLGSDTIAKNFSVTSTCILKVLRKNGVQRRDFTRKLGSKHEEIIELYKSGISAPKIAIKLNVTHGAILKILKKNNIDRRTAEECHRIYEINENFFDEINTEEKAYMLGFLYADGNNSSNKKAITIDLNIKDREILVKFCNLIYKDKNSDLHVRTVDRTEEGRDVFSVLCFYSKHMCKKLTEHGCMIAKTFKITYPNWMDKNLQRHFVRGYFDGDGSLGVIDCAKAATEVKMVSTLSVVNGIKQILENTLNVHMGIDKCQNSNVYTVATTGNRQMQTVLDWLYKDASIYLERKFKIYLNLLEKNKETDRLIAIGTQGFSKPRKIYLTGFE